MPFGTVIDETRVCDFGPLYTVLLHYCDNLEPEKCHPELNEHSDQPDRAQRIREVPGVNAAQLRGTTLIIGLDKTFAPWSDVYIKVDAIMRSS